MLDLGFPETSQSLSSFKQPFFFISQRGPKEKNKKTCESPQKSGSSFPNRNPLFKILSVKKMEIINRNIEKMYGGCDDFASNKTSSYVQAAVLFA